MLETKIADVDGNLITSVLEALAENLPNLDGAIGLVTHALLSARETADQTVGLTCTNGVQNPLHVQLADATNLGYIGASGENRNIVKITDDFATTVDVELVNSITDNLDAKQSLVTNAVLNARKDNDTVNPLHLTTITNKNDDIDGKNALVSAAALYARTSDTGAVMPLRSYATSADGVNAVAWCLRTIAHNYGYNGSTYDRQRSKTANGADITNTEIGFLTVVNLNYVWDAANTKWVPMTQPT